MQTAIQQISARLFIHWELIPIQQMIKAAKAYRNYQTALRTDPFIIEAQIARKRTEISAKLDNIAKSELSEDLHKIDELKKAILSI